jgi:hypothetical protein
MIVCSQARSLRRRRSPSSVSGRLPIETAKCPEPLRLTCGVTASPGSYPARPRKELPFLHSSYGLMRQTTSLSCHLRFPLVVSPCGTCQSPLGRWSFPTLSPQSLRRRLDPLPRQAPRVLLPTSSPRTTASRQGQHARRSENSLQCSFHRALHFEAAVIR